MLNEKGGCHIENNSCTVSVSWHNTMIKVKHLEQIRYFSFSLYLTRFILRTDCGSFLG